MGACEEASRLGRLELLRREFVVRDLIDPVLEVVRTAVAEVQIIAVLPDIDAEKRLALASRERVGAVRRLRDLQLAVGSEHEPGPAGTELTAARGLEGVLELLHAAEILGDFLLERARDFAAVLRRHRLPE